MTFVRLVDVNMSHFDFPTPSAFLNDTISLPALTDEKRKRIIWLVNFLPTSKPWSGACEYTEPARHHQQTQNGVELLQKAFYAASKLTSLHIQRRHQTHFRQSRNIPLLVLFLFKKINKIMKITMRMDEWMEEEKNEWQERHERRANRSENSAHTMRSLLSIVNANTVGRTANKKRVGRKETLPCTIKHASANVPRRSFSPFYFLSTNTSAAF